jgi:hypothetical protein
MRSARIYHTITQCGFFVSVAILFLIPGIAESEGQDQKSPKIPQNRPLRNITIPANKGWVDCGWHLFQGQSIEIWAEGEVSCGKEGAESCGPDGYPNSSGGFWKAIPKANTGALIGRIGAKSARYFLVGSHSVVKAVIDGKLYLRVNDDNQFDNKGEFKVFLGFH